MKNTSIFKNIGRMSIAIAVLGTALLSSCLKDTSPGTINFATSTTVVGWQYYGFSGNFSQPIGIKVHGTDQDTASVKITLSTKSITLGSATTVTVADDPSDATAFTAANGGTVMNASEYTIANTTVVIPAGQQYGFVHIKFKGSAIDFSSTPTMALKITSASGAVVASNLNIAVLQLTLQSIYEGDYTDNGYTLRGTDMVLGGYFKGYDEQLATVSQYSVTYTVLWATDVPAGGVGGTSITVDPNTNKVTMASSANPTLHNKPGYDNRYDPATKTFYISMDWGTAGNRSTTDTLIYKGPL